MKTGDVMRKSNRMIFLVTKKMEFIVQVLRILQESREMNLLDTIKKLFDLYRN